MQVNANERFSQTIGLRRAEWMEPVSPTSPQGKQGGTCTSQLRDGSSSGDKTVGEARGSLRGQRLRAAGWV